MSDLPELAREMSAEQLFRAARHAIENAADMDQHVHVSLQEVKSAIFHLKIMRDRLARWDAENKAFQAAQQSAAGSPSGQ